MTNSRRARATAAAVAVLALVLCLWRDGLWFQQVTVHQAAADIGSADGFPICDPFWGDAFYHTQWNQLWPLLAINSAVIWIPGFIGYILSFGALALVAWRYVSWAVEIVFVRQAVATGQCGSELWIGTMPAWLDVAVFVLALGLLCWRLATATKVVLKARLAWTGA